MNILARFKRVDNTLVNIMRVVVASIICIELLLLFTGVIARYFFHHSIMWIDEIASYLLVIVTFLGAYVALKDRSLAAVTAMVDKLPFVPQKIVKTVANVCIIILLVAITYYGIYLCMQPAITKTLTPILRLPLAYFYAALPLTSILMFCHMVLLLIEDIIEQNSNNNVRITDQEKRSEG